MVQISTYDKDRFWSNVAIRDASDCWHWTGNISRGYGRFFVRGKIWRAHRFSHFLDSGDLDASAVIMHTCDNRRCVNPSHLKSGTIAENNADKQAKGRQLKGEEIGCSRLTARDVQFIREASKRGLKIARIAAFFDAYPQSIRTIVSRKSWVHLADEENPNWFLKRLAELSLRADRIAEANNILRQLPGEKLGEIIKILREQSEARHPVIGGLNG